MNVIARWREWRRARGSRLALRAVVERHRPVPCLVKACAGGEHTTCEACGSGRTYEKCPDTVAIAAALGVEIEETPK